MKTLIIDDDMQAACYLEEQLKNYPDVVLVGKALNGLDGLRMMREHLPELLFLDIELPDLSGIDFLERLDNYSHGHCRVVMYSAYDKYMLSAFRNHAFDFLVKPFDSKELRIVMQRVYTDRKYAPEQPGCALADTDSAGPGASGMPSGAHGACSPHGDMSPAADVPVPGEAADSGGCVPHDGKILLYTNAVDFRLVNIRDIGVFQYNSESRSWEALLAGVKEPVRLKRNVNSDMLVAIGPDFVQVHQKFIINMSYLIEVTSNSCSFFPPFDNISHVHVGRTYRGKLVEKFNSL